MIRSWVNWMIASMIFFPVREFSYQPADFGLRAEEVYCDTSDGVRIHGWFLKADSETAALLLFHGNADNISIRLPKAREWIRRGISVFLVDYRGYGKSAGKIKTAHDLILDGQAAYDWLTAHRAYEPSQVILYGESIGAFPAIQLAAKQNVKALILEAPFTSLKELAKLHYGFAPDFFLKDFDMPNEIMIQKIRCPFFLIHGAEDEIVPISMGERLFEQAPAPKEFFKVPHAHHNDLMDAGGQDFFEKPFRFVKNAGRK